MNSIKAIKKLSEEELRLGITEEASWHNRYKHSAYIHIGGLNFDMNEGDIVQVFSQCGEIVDCNLIRDKQTGRSKGFAFLAYEDQRSTVLAVDNLNGISLCGRTIKVDHCDNYRAGQGGKLYVPSGPDGKGWGNFTKLTDQTLDEHNNKT
eukprot:CAMPEP_0202434496 /NCGR_PEP_ID=MMETSP1345-20130828/15295_1 /ASSEMBLY_ACC=CAM_ASM_000843 /TAXON_ID=342563 /ORGANISM="Fabrea Fabrea salina" /LENGTH=149 /DNA_ID=CAMNT_0049047173 /DNA_START=785 /DNA_END=1234 /DNA_ORIENTATION=-